LGEGSSFTFFIPKGESKASEWPMY
jgi:hypothetical protein